MLYETLTGEAPFARWTEGPEVLAHVEAPRPSVRAVRPDLPPQFDEVVRRAMAKDPSERYPSAGDLGEAALVAAGGQNRAREWSMVATGEAAPVAGDHPSAMVASGDGAAARDGAAPSEGSDVVRWAIALAGLVLVAIGMVAALQGISNL